MTKQPKDVPYPPEWGKDSLTAFFQNAHENCLLAFTQKSPDVGILQEVHQLYRRLNSSRWGDKLLPQFIARSETSFLAACRIVLGGQVVETYPLLRSSLEAALYGFYIVNKELHEVWVRRGESPETTKDARNVFTVKKILNALREENGVLAERAKKLYDLTIDYGAHPNSEGYLSTSQTGDNGVNVDYLMAGSLPWKIAVQETYKTGIISLRVLEVGNEIRFNSVGVQPRLDQLDAEWGRIRTNRT